ncbi:hypothetical protein [Archangium sp.]|nr:hypothetical protein [Archangium sp.]HYO55011.1 hypothetical protein [Archangium sp.]
MSVSALLVLSALNTSLGSALAWRVGTDSPRLGVLYGLILLGVGEAL